MDVKIKNENEIVLVDDDKDETFLLEQFYRMSDLKNKLISFQSGKEFLDYMEKVREHQADMPALVLLDVRMPGLSGFDVLENLRNDEDFVEDPAVLMFSNSNAPSDIKKAMELGANGYQTKLSNMQSYISFLNSLDPNLP